MVRQAQSVWALSPAISRVGFPQIKLYHKDDSDSFDFDDFYMFLCGETLGAASSRPVCSLLGTTLGSGPNGDEAAQQLEVVAERQLPWPVNIARFLTKLDFRNPTTSVPEALQGTAA